MHACTPRILRDPGAAGREDASGDAIFLGESLHQEKESPWAITLTEPLHFQKRSIFSTLISHKSDVLANHYGGRAGRLCGILTRS